MADYRDILAGLQVGDMDKRDALTQGLLMAAAGALQGGDRGSMLARTIYGGMQGYQDSISAKEKQLMQQLALRKQATELAEYERKKDDERALAEAMQKAQGAPRATFAPGSVQSPAFAPDVNAGLPAAPAQPNPREQRRQMLQATIDNLIQRGAGHMAAPLQAELAKMEEEYSPEVRYDQQGNAFLVSKQGGVKPLAGIKARDEIIGENLGDVERYRTKYSLDSKGIVARGQSPDSKASNATTMRGQNLTDARAREGLELQREAQRTQIVDNPQTGPLLIDKATGQARPAVSATTGQAIPGEIQTKRETGAKQVLNLLTEAEKHIDGATGSYVGAGYDLAARGVGHATEGAKSIAALRTIEGALLAHMPRMEGPQSDRDVQLYRQAAGQLGDPTVTQEEKKIAIGAIRAIQQKYAGVEQPNRNSGQIKKAAPRPGTVDGGYIFRGGDPADPKNWSPAK